MSEVTLYSFIAGLFFGALAIIQFAPNALLPPEQPHSLFVYGTLKNNIIRYYACSCLVPQTPVVLSGYKRIGLNIVPSADDFVAGSILQVSTAQLKRIDRYENVPKKYTRQRMTINGETHWVYIKNS